MAEVETPVLATRSPDTDQRQVDRLGHTGVILGGSQPTRSDALTDQRLEFGFDHRAPTLIDHVDLRSIEIDPDHLVAGGGQAGGSDRSDITEPVNPDSHLYLPPPRM